MSITNPTPNALPTILYREDSLVDTTVVYYYKGKLMELTITNSDLTYLEYGEMQEYYSFASDLETRTWELWSTTDRLTDKQLAELIQSEKYLQNKSKPESVSSFKMYGAIDSIRRLTTKRYYANRTKHPRNKHAIIKARKHYKNGMRVAMESLAIIERLLCKLRED